jgi:hypothetical protein
MVFWLLQLCSEVEQTVKPMQNSPESGARNRTDLNSPYSCEEVRRLLDAFGVAVQELMQLHEQQFLAVVDGDHEAGRFDLLIHDANQRKQNAKYALIAHVDTHGCSSGNEETINR